MEIKLTHTESELYFYNALCNGLSYISGYNLELTYDETAYNDAKNRLKEKSPDGLCYEDVLMEILRGGGVLTLEDREGNEDSASITLQEVHNRVPLTQLNHLMNMINENDDAETADVILQTVFLQDIVYG
jgi:hypothetical protein